MTTSKRDPVDALAEEFAARYRRGERPAVSEYVERCPERGDEIRELFPALVVMERLKPEAAERPPDALGEYRIVREVGRGGMGVVYEAVQETLGRRVALKVLSAGWSTSPRQLERFRREARAAARLHHTNIVPVFGVGEAGGVAYYAMQFIDGHGIDAVLRDVRRLRAGETLPDEPASAAASLVADRFPDAPAVTEGAASTTSGSALAPSGPSAYYRSVARVGLQIAEALAHAHHRGVLHRDIKPSNLLLDLHGNVWITDFGLAKADDSDDLTGTGDVIGTVRYMAPERFNGRSLPQSDVYGLGVTLYEMLALRPAFDAPDRLDLADQIRTRRPLAPRALDPRVPRDLETIVLKCLAKDPRDRYVSADLLVEDLRRFLADRPVRARRASGLEQAWRWARRNPALAAVGAAALFFLAGGLALTYSQWRRAEANADRAEASYRWAYGAVDTLLDDFALMTHARDAERLRAAQQRVLRHAAALQDEYSERISPTHRQRADLADAALRGAAFKEALGDTAGAEAAYERVLDLVRGDEGLARFAGRAYFYRGMNRKRRGELPAADAELRQAVGLLQTDAGDAGSRLYLAQALTDWAELAHQQRKAADAHQRYGAAHVRLATLADGLDPESHEACQIRFLAGQNDVMWAALHFAERRPAEEAACYRRAADAADDLLTRRPEDGLFRRLANQARVGLGDVARRAGKPRVAEVEYRIAAGHSRKLIEQMPEEADFRALHARTLNQLVIVLEPERAGERQMTAEEAARHVWVAVSKRPDAILYRSYLTPCIGGFVAASRRTGDHAGVARLAETFATGPPWGDGEESFAAASMLCTASGFADAQAAPRYRDRAVAAFRQAVERGFREAARVTPDNEFRAVYERDDFTVLRKSISSEP